MDEVWAALGVLVFCVDVKLALQGIQHHILSVDCLFGPLYCECYMGVGGSVHARCALQGFFVSVDWVSTRLFECSCQVCTIRHFSECRLGIYKA